MAMHPNAARGKDIEVSSFCHSFAAYKENAHSCLRGFHIYAASTLLIPTLIRVIRLPLRSREEGGAIRGPSKRKSLSHSSPGKFERSSRNCFQRWAISNLPVLERLTGDRALSKTRGGGAAGNHLCGDDYSHRFADWQLRSIAYANASRVVQSMEKGKSASRACLGAPVKSAYPVASGERKKPEEKTSQAPDNTL